MTDTLEVQIDRIVAELGIPREDAAEVAARRAASPVVSERLVRASCSIIRSQHFSISEALAIMTGAMAPPETMAA